MADRPKRPHADQLDGIAEGARMMVSEEFARLEGEQPGSMLATALHLWANMVQSDAAAARAPASPGASAAPDASTDREVGLYLAVLRLLSPAERREHEAVIAGLIGSAYR